MKTTYTFRVSTKTCYIVIAIDADNIDDAEKELLKLPIQITFHELISPLDAVTLNAYEEAADYLENELNNWDMSDVSHGAVSRLWEALDFLKSKQKEHSKQLKPSPTQVEKVNRECALDYIENLITLDSEGLTSFLERYKEDTDAEDSELISKAEVENALDKITEIKK